MARTFSPILVKIQCLTDGNEKVSINQAFAGPWWCDPTSSMDERAARAAFSAVLGSCLTNVLRGILMKNTTLPPVRIDQALRDAVETVLKPGESFSAFTEASVREMVQRRQLQQAFIARGLAAAEEAQRTGIYHDAQAVHEQLRQQLEAAKRARGK
jgi:predicted transcriptional regulator